MPTDQQDKKNIGQSIKKRIDQAKKDRELRKRRKARQVAEKKYESELNAEGRTSKSRKKENSAYHKWGRRLVLANILVFILLVIAVWMVFYV